MNDLIGRCIAREPQAAEELYRLYYRRVRDFAMRLGENPTDAEEVAQEAVLAGLEGIRAGRRPERLTYWLLGIARHISAGLPRVRNELTQALEAPPGSARTLAIRQEMDGLLGRLVERLPEGLREVLRLLHREGLSRKEAADRLDIPVETLHARCERAYGRLREELSRHFTTVALSRFEPRRIELSVIQKLRPAFRQAVTVRHLEDLPEGPAAERLGVPLPTLRARLASAYAMLKCDASADFAPARDEYRKKKKGDSGIVGDEGK